MSIDLKRFCGCEHDIREYVRQPWAHQGYVYATNGHICVRVPAPEHAGTTSEVPIAESARGLFERATNTEYAPLPPFTPAPVCFQCEGEGHYKQSKCGDCDGEGNFKRGHHEYECRECEGTGWLPDDEGQKRDCEECWGTGHDRRAVDFGNDVFYDARYLAWVKALPGVMFAPGGASTTDKPMPGHFVCAGGEGLLMPMHG